MIAPDQLMGFVWIAWVVSWLAAALWSDRAATRPSRRTRDWISGCHDRGCRPAVWIWESGFYMKARLEEGFLRQELGADAYDAYARRVAMLVPWR